MIYATRHREDRDATDVIASTFKINFVPYFALIDVRSTHSYVAYSMFDKLKILVEGTTSDVTVLSPLGQSVYVNKIFKRCPL